MMSLTDVTAFVAVDTAADGIALMVLAHFALWLSTFQRLSNPSAFKTQSAAV